jgi:hypothetical protein
MWLWLNTVALALGVLGTGILAFSLNGVLREFDTAIDFIDLTLETMLQPRADVFKARGLPERIRRAGAKSAAWTLRGLFMIAAAFALQLMALWATK